MHNNISINYKIMTVFASDIAIYRRMSHDEYYDCRSEQTTCLKEDLSDYEGYLYIDNKKFLTQIDSSNPFLSVWYIRNER